MPFLIIFILIPLAELYVFGIVGGQIGLFNALFMALITAMIGGAVVRHQGMTTLREAQAAMQRGQIPMGELFDGICLIAAGATLITPGFITDTIGFLLLVPAVRSALLRIIQTRTTWTDISQPGAPKRDESIIDVEFEDLDKK